MKSDGRHALGQAAEEFVARHLAREGFAIVGRNVRVGRLELDVLARRGSLLVVCEVRARSSDTFMSPWESLDAAKLERIRRATARWIARGEIKGRVDVRFDVASVLLVAGKEPQLQYFERAFE